MTIGVDLDNCVADLWRCALPLARDWFGREVALEDITEWEMWNCMGISRDAFMQYHDACLSGAVEIEPVPGAVQALLDLSKAGHEVTIVTARSTAFDRETRGWLRKQGIGGLPLLTDCSDKASARRWDAFVDDRLATVIELARVVPKVFLFDRPWNQAHQLPARVTRVPDWKAIREAIGV